MYVYACDCTREMKLLDIVPVTTQVTCRTHPRAIHPKAHTHTQVANRLLAWATQCRPHQARVTLHQAPQQCHPWWRGPPTHL